MLRLISVMVCGLLFACGQPNATCTRGDHCVHYLSGLPGAPGTGGNGSGADMAHASGGGGDMAHAASGDMSQPASGDMATAASTDMATACLPTGGNCSFHNDAACCSNYCIYATNLCR